MLAVNTIRTLSIDAIQKANSGHPGTAMDAAPTAYALWQQVLRYDPKTPHWINRDRFVLSAGHASMLLYSLIHLAGIEAAETSYQKAGGEAVSLADIEVLPRGRQPLPGSPRIWLDHGRRIHDRPAGTRSCHQRRHGDRRQMAGRHLQQARLRHLRFQCLRALAAKAA